MPPHPIKTIQYLRSKQTISDPSKRCEHLMKIIKTDNLTNNQIEEVRKLCHEFSEAFYIEGDKLQTTDIYQHSIKLKPDIDTVFVKQYRIPETQKAEIDKQINSLLDTNIYRKEYK